MTSALPSDQLEIAVAPAPDSDAAVAGLYREHALGLTRLAYVMLGSRTSAEDIVQEAFLGLHRRWQFLSSPDKALPYLRSSVLNGCRSARRRAGAGPPTTQQPPAPSAEPSAPSAEAAALVSDERRQVIAGLQRLPARQREALMLRFYLNLPDAQIASQMGISQSTVRSTMHRALAALGVELTEASS